MIALPKVTQPLNANDNRALPNVANLDYAREIENQRWARVEYFRWKAERRWDRGRRKLILAVFLTVWAVIAFVCLRFIVTTTPV